MPAESAGSDIGDIARAESAVAGKRCISLFIPSDESRACPSQLPGRWAVRILAAFMPELFGPILVAVAPLSYCGRVRGNNPIRCSGGPARR